jgi:hypothetical protein
MLSTLTVVDEVKRVLDTARAADPPVWSSNRYLISGVFTPHS